MQVKHRFNTVNHENIEATDIENILSGKTWMLVTTEIYVVA